MLICKINIVFVSCYKLAIGGRSVVVLNTYQMGVKLLSGRVW